MTRTEADIKCGKTECFANKRGLCDVLCEYIIDKPCPFYKPKSEAEQEIDTLENDDINTNTEVNK